MVICEGEWKYSDGWKLEEVSFTDITAATVDPYGQLLFIGSGDGHFHFVCVRTGLPLTYNLQRIRHTLEAFDKSRVQAVSCALHPYNLTRDKYRLLCAAGTVSGLFQVFVVSVKRKGSSSDDQKTQSMFHLVNAMTIASSAAHSVNQEMHGIGVRGGTLCVCTQEQLAVSGGGDGRCTLVVFYSTTYPCEDTWDETIDDLGAPVTAVTAEQNIIAAGLANGNVRIYSCTAYHPYVQLARIDHVSNVPITGLAWGMCKELSTLHRLILAVGDLAGSVRTYRVRDTGQNVLNEELESPGDPILDIRIRDHLLVVGTSTSKICLWRLSDSAQCHILRRADFREEANRKDIEIKRLMGVSVFFQGLLRPTERFEPRCARGEQFEIYSEQLSDDEDENSVVEEIEPEGQEAEPDHDGAKSVDSYESLSDFPRLRFVNPQKEPEPKDDQVFLLVSQCLTSTTGTGGQRTRINHPLRYRILRAL